MLLTYSPDLSPNHHRHRVVQELTDALIQVWEEILRNTVPQLIGNSQKLDQPVISSLLALILGTILIPALMEGHCEIEGGKKTFLQRCSRGLRL